MELRLLKIGQFVPLAGYVIQLVNWREQAVGFAVIPNNQITKDDPTDKRKTTYISFIGAITIPELCISIHASNIGPVMRETHIINLCYMEIGHAQKIAA